MILQSWRLVCGALWASIRRGRTARRRPVLFVQFGWMRREMCRSASQSWRRLTMRSPLSSGRVAVAIYVSSLLINPPSCQTQLAPGPSTRLPDRSSRGWAEASSPPTDPSSACLMMTRRSGASKPSSVPRRIRSALVLAATGRFLIEVFPALALASLDDGFCMRLKGPRYNPSRRKTFRLDDWHRVLSAVAKYAHQASIDGLAIWCKDHSGIKSPKKSDQDMLDAVLCALIGFHWRVRPRSESILLGNTATGYMIAPVCAAARERLEAAAARRGVAVDGVIRSEDSFSAADQEAG